MLGAALCALALVAVGSRYFVLRHDRRTTEHTVAGLKDDTRAALVVLREVTHNRDGADDHNRLAQGERDRVRTVALALHTDLDRAQAETISSAIGAFTSGAQANNLAACLVGVSQALNQLSVGDNQALQSLSRVEGPCRSAGVG